MTTGKVAADVALKSMLSRHEGVVVALAALPLPTCSRLISCSMRAAAAPAAPSFWLASALYSCRDA